MDNEGTATNTEGVISLQAVCSSNNQQGQAAGSYRGVGTSFSETTFLQTMFTNVTAGATIVINLTTVFIAPNIRFGTNGYWEVEYLPPAYSSERSLP